MGLRSSGRKLSFDILSKTSSFEDADGSPLFSRSNSDPTRSQNDAQSDVSFQNPKSRKRKKHRKKKPTTPLNDCAVIPEDPVNYYDDAVVSSEVVFENRSDLNCQSYVSGGSATSVCTVASENVYNKGELRQRNVNGSEEAESRPEESSTTTAAEKQPQQRMSEANGSVVTKLETAESLDWKRLMAEDSNYTYSLENSPLKYFLEAMSNGNSLQSTTTLADEKERERVYDTIFRLPWRCELLIDVGFFVCFDSFLSLLTIMPTRILISLWRLLSVRQFNRPSAAELCDFACFVVLVCGVTLLQQTGVVKTVTLSIFDMIFDKLCQSFGGDVLQTLFNSAEGLANCSEENMSFWIWRFISDQALATAASNILSQAITLSTCIVAHNNALLALLVSNNFAEIKSNVFKRFSTANIHGLVYADSVERFHISAFLLFVLAQNILEAEGPWFQSFLFNALLVFMCEMLIDIIKHSFLAKFNDIKPIAYSEFLEDLCKQTLNMQTGNGKKNLTFVPLAPACVVIRVLTPVFAARLPCNPVSLRLFWIVILSAVTYIMLTSLKVMIGMGLQKHATWYVKRCEKRRHHLHYD
ncbi:hypothetical protein JRO89_XS05G0204400 [Xanthoceras sorbifolium]|uniref:Protein POLLEN DEFECTIVE IN GUIDANCE 1 n=1 Tax=Xanthoceras sorbifolium TaxID=99658 RepID=A0ABQ8I303_9ROSI|nr:hypothetical protein JRO89_XS05G0204400 [Xanthoceras sorbifolium]